MERIAIGEVSRPHGTGGRLKVHPLTEHPERFLVLKEVYLGGTKRRVVSCQLTPGGVILGLEGIVHRQQAEALRGQLLEVDAEEVFPLPEGEYYWFELKGLRVVGEDGREIGCVADVFRTPAHDVLVVSRGERQHLVPATRAVVAQVDLEGGRLVVRDWPGLLD